MRRLGIEMPRSAPAFSVEEAEKVAAELGYPVVIRPAYTLGGTGGGHVYNVEELRVIASRGLAASMVNQILVEESVLGWEELELEVVRDARGQLITVCFIENVDAMGVHTGDSYCVAPMLTIDPKLQARLQEYSYRIVEAIGVIGGTNVQFAHDPKTDRVVVIEINPRTSRSSALASKATGFPIALVSAKLAGGLTLDEIPYWRDGTLEKYTPSGDYVVVKFSRFAFEKFRGAQDRLGTQMRAVGEVMSIGKNYKEAFQKAIRSLENGRHGLGFAKDFHTRSLDELMQMLNEPSSERQWIMYEALRQGAGVPELYRKTHIKPWFIEQMRELVALEEEILRYRGRELPDALLVRAKQDGFADKYLARLLRTSEDAIRTRRIALGVVERWDAVPVSGVENAAYYYSTYNAPDRVLMVGVKLKDLALRHRVIPHVGVKEVVLPFNMFPEVDPVLGPEMRSTGEVLGMAPTFGLAYFKSQEAASPPLPTSGSVFISVTDREKPAMLEIARRFQELGFRIKATRGTQEFLERGGVRSERSFKINEVTRPNILDELTSREIALVINTPIGKAGKIDDSYIRKAAIKYKVPYVTTTAAARAAALGIHESRTGRTGVKSLQSYHAEIR